MTGLRPESLAARRALAALARRFHQAGWLYGTSGNLSARITAGTEPWLVITASGRDKGDLGEEGFVETDLDGKLVRAGSADDRPSAEVAIHGAIYGSIAGAGAVLHVHTVASSLVRPVGPLPGTLVFQGLEMLKGWGLWEPDARAELPVFPNHPEVPRIAREVRAWLCEPRPAPALVVAGHGITAWGTSIGDAARHLEVAEFLCQVARAGASAGLPPAICAG
jgi:methylthioribulose-1-phosphate dehydratase